LDNMNPCIIALDKLEELGEDPYERLAWNLANGYIYSSPTAFAMAHLYDVMGESVLWVEIVAGDMVEAFSHAPTAKRVCYLRKGCLKSRDFESLWKHLKLLQPLGSIDP